MSGVELHLTEHIARSLLLSSRYYGEAGNSEMADLRSSQARALAEAYGHELSDDAVGDEELEAFLEEAAE